MIFHDQLVMQLMNGLIRPGFSLFFAQCASLGIPVALYTAAEHEWATFLAQAVRFEMELDLENPPRDFLLPPRLHVRLPPRLHLRLPPRLHLRLPARFLSCIPSEKLIRRNLDIPT